MRLARSKLQRTVQRANIFVSVKCQLDRRVPKHTLSSCSSEATCSSSVVCPSVESEPIEGAGVGAGVFCSGASVAFASGALSLASRDWFAAWKMNLELGSEV